MKTDRTIRCTIMAAAAAITASSCVSSYNYITTDIHRDLSADRTLYAQADSSYLAGDEDFCPFLFLTDSLWTTGQTDPAFSMDFYDETQTMNVYARRHFQSVGKDAMLPADPDYRDCPQLNPEESVEKHFRWFYTLYEYKAVYKCIPDLPVPVSEFLAPEQQKFFLLGEGIPDGWNGVELYCALDEMNTGFSQWYVKSTFKVSHDIVSGFCSPEMKTVMEENSESILRKAMDSEQDVTPSILCEWLDKADGTDRFTRLYDIHKSEADSAYAEKEKTVYFFTCALISEVSMPGKLIRTNAEDFHDGAPRWKVDGYRLLYGDLTLSATSRESHPWAYVLTFIILWVVLYLIIRRFQRSI